MIVTLAPNGVRRASASCTVMFLNMFEGRREDGHDPDAVFVRRGRALRPRGLRDRHAGHSGRAASGWSFSRLFLSSKSSPKFSHKFPPKSSRENCKISTFLLFSTVMTHERSDSVSPKIFLFLICMH